MGHSSVAEAIYGVSPTARGVGRVSDLVAAMTPPAPATGTALAPVAPPHEALSKKLIKFVPHVVGAGAGFVLWKKHRILGALAGHALVNSGYEYYKGDKKTALCELAVEGAGIAGALYLFKGRKPVMGWLAGVLAGSVATYFVQDSPVQKAVKKLRG